MNLINKFVFIIPSYNNEKWYKNNLESILIQTYKNWRIIYVDDNSSDSTYLLVSNFIKNNNISDKVTLIRNKLNYKQAYSRYIAYNKCYDDEICILLDGDDWLYDRSVLETLNYYYTNYNLNITYGSYVKYINGIVEQNLFANKEFPDYIVKNNLYSRYKWISGHLRTCRAKLLKTIPENYLKDYDNNWLKVSTDLAEMLWVLKISDGRHMNINKPLCVYNVDNSISYGTSYYNHDYDSYRQSINRKIRYYYDNNSISKFNLTTINNVFDKVYVLNLKSDLNKYLFTQKRLLKYGIISSRFEAINGNNYINEYNKNKYLEEANLYRSYGAYGCLKSKIAILQDAIYNNYNKILILEDDILLANDFNTKFDLHYNNIPTDWKILYFGSSDRNINYIDNEYYYKPSYTSNGTFAFGLDSSIYEELLYNFKKMNLPDDHHLMRLSLKYDQYSYIFNPNLIIADTTTSSTTIKFNYQDMYNIYINRINKFNWDLNNYDFEYLPSDSKMFDILINITNKNNKIKEIDYKMKTSSNYLFYIIIFLVAISIFIYFYTKKRTIYLIQ